MKQFLVLVLMIFLVGCDKEVGNQNVIEDKEVILENSKKDLKNQTTESEFGEKEIKEFLLKADSSKFFENIYCGDEIIGSFENLVLHKVKGEFDTFEKVSTVKGKYFTAEMIKAELSKLQIYTIDNMLGYIPCTKRGFEITEESKVKIVESSSSKVKVEIDVFLMVI